MGIAAYNRGTAAFSRQIDATLPSADTILLRDLNAHPKGDIRPYGPTVIRLDSDGQWWLMNHPEKGWSSYGWPYRSLWAIARKYALDFLGYGRDEYSIFVAVQPASPKQESPP